MKLYIVDEDGNEIGEFYDNSDLDSIAEILDPSIHKLVGEDGCTDFAPEFELLCEILEEGIEDKVFAALEVWPTAYNLETAYRAATDCYVGYFDSESDLAESVMTNYEEIPSFLVVDWQATGELLAQDYLEYNGHYFRK